MPSMRWIAPICVCLLVPAAPARGFDLAAYRQFLANHVDLTASDLLADHRPPVPYRDRIDVPLASVAFLEAMNARYTLTEDELELLRRNGFLVSERLVRPSYGDALHEIWHWDLPIFVSSDLILHTVHRSFLRVLGAIETDYVSPRLLGALTALRNSLPALDARHAADPAMQVCLEDLDVHLTVAVSLLLGTPVASVYTANTSLVAALLAAVESAAPADFALYNEQPRTIDFSQFSVRGYYTESEILTRYFRCMMWLGRIDFRLSPPPGLQASGSVQREVVDAFLLRELVELSGTSAAFDGIDRILRLFVGTPDNTTLDDLDAMAAELELADASTLWDPETYVDFTALLDSDRYQSQAINSRILMDDPMSGEPIRLPYAFLLMGQRFTVDSHVLGSVVYDRIQYQGTLPFRGLPDPLDVLYALGNDDVLPLLRSELQTYHYASNLEALRYLIDSYDDTFWGQSLYNRWLHAIRALAKTGDQGGVPEFMRTAAWQQQKMNSQLAAWAELRHDTLLYVKQSYTTGTVCSYPYGYVEPVPAFFARLDAFARFARDEILATDLPATLLTRVRSFYNGMSSIMLTLQSIAQKELDRVPLSEEENAFLQSVLYIDSSQCEQPETGWLRYLYFDRAEQPAHTPDWLVADVHTQPTDEIGSPVGHVLHVGTSDPRIAIVVAGCEDGSLRAYAGPVASYHQHVTSNFRRLTDREWESWFGYLHARPPVPDWTWIYAADGTGRIREGGRVLDQGWTVSVDDPQSPDPVRPPAPSRIAWINSAPNPFNPRTVIGFEVQGPEALEVRVRVFDARGVLVRELLRDRLRPDTWFVVWDGSDQAGAPAASGVYYAQVDGASRSLSTKLTLVR